MERTFNILADFHQILLRDVGADWVSLADLWTSKTIREGLVQGPGFLALATARDTLVPLTIRVELGQPSLTEGFDRVAIGRLSLPNGELVVTGITDGGASGGSLRVRPGDYAVRVLFGSLDTLSADGLSGGDHYVVELWPEMTEVLPE